MIITLFFCIRTEMTVGQIVGPDSIAKKECQTVSEDLTTNQHVVNLNSPLL